VTASWLTPLRAALDESGGRVDVFFRDDDAGWDDERLWLLLGRFDAAGAPLDIAVIPEQLTADLAHRLRARAAAAGGRVSFHQHGWAHVNHERDGRKHEFGPSRAEADQRADIQRGRAVLLEAFGEAGVGCFVPPWNRCTDVTARLVLDLGFRVLSRDLTATSLPVPGLRQVPITVDWFARRNGHRVDREGRAALLAAAARRGRIGLMLHHAVMTEDDLSDLDDVLALVTAHEAVALTTLVQSAARPARESAETARGSTSGPAR
jgi:peptidoglycan/xylan/chitin deacetylase (PgdA/CDA1 family)